MEISYTPMDLLLYLLLYSFIAWGIEVCIVAVRDRRFVNRGFLNLPVNLPYGIAAALLLPALATLKNVFLEYGMIWVVLCLVQALSNQFLKGISRKYASADYCSGTASGRNGIPLRFLVAGVYLLFYLIVHPLVFSLVTLMPALVVRIVVIAAAVLVGIDFFSVLYTLRTNRSTPMEEARQETTQYLARRMSDTIWRRLQKAYPGIGEENTQEGNYVFAKGICFDKMVWVFLVSSFLGALIEMAFCRVTAGYWMSRSSVLYGAFSFVWGLGSVVLTVTLQRIAHKPDRYIFLAGFIIGGAYEYLCSVFTELVFGTVFWDYSEMPLNIGGRTNVLYCVFWGLLSVAWIKVLYPPMDKAIEKLPPLPGKITTWIIVFVMVCNGLLTSSAMLRYTDRQSNPRPDSVIAQFLDARYDDAYMEKRWPNMLVTEK